MLKSSAAYFMKTNLDYSKENKKVAVSTGCCSSLQFQKEEEARKKHTSSSSTSALNCLEQLVIYVQIVSLTLEAAR